MKELLFAILIACFSFPILAQDNPATRMIDLEESLIGSIKNGDEIRSQQIIDELSYCHYEMDPIIRDAVKNSIAAAMGQDASIDYKTVGEECKEISFSWSRIIPESKRERIKEVEALLLSTYPEAKEQEEQFRLRIYELLISYLYGGMENVPSDKKDVTIDPNRCMISRPLNNAY